MVAETETNLRPPDYGPDHLRDAFQSYQTVTKLFLLQNFLMGVALSPGRFCAEGKTWRIATEGSDREMRSVDHVPPRPSAPWRAAAPFPCAHASIRFVP